MYWLSEGYWGRGLMSEAVLAFSTFSFDSLGLERIEASIFFENMRSARLVESLGFQKGEIKSGEMVYYLRNLQ